MREKMFSAGEHRYLARNQALQYLEPIAELQEEAAHLKKMLRNPRNSFKTRAFLKDQLAMARETADEYRERMRGWWRVVRLTRVCPKCRGGRKYRDRRFTRFVGERTYRNCTGCRGEGAVWVRKM